MMTSKASGNSSPINFEQAFEKFNTGKSDTKSVSNNNQLETPKY